MLPNIKRKNIYLDDEEDTPLMARKKPKKSSPKTKKKKRKYDDDEESDEPEEVCATCCCNIVLIMKLRLREKCQLPYFTKSRSFFSLTCMKSSVYQNAQFHFYYIHLYYYL